MNGMRSFTLLGQNGSKGSRINPDSSEIRLGLQDSSWTFYHILIFWIKATIVKFSDVITMEGGDQKARPVARIY